MPDDPRHERETLTIRNFLTIKEATLSVSRFTLVIGPQANGKSVVAKLLYFFRSFLGRQFLQSIEKLSTKRELQSEGVAAFERIFPRYAWGDQPFEVTYRYDAVAVTLARKTGRGRSLTLTLDYSAALADVHIRARAALKRKLQELESIEDPGQQRSYRRYEVFWDVQREYVRTGELAGVFRAPVFIPASRSFFATLQKTVFSFLANNVAIDPLIKEFGSVYENAKLTYRRRAQTSPRHAGGAAQPNALVRQEIERILSGQYVVEDDQDWIVSGKRRVNLVNASSGQQESLPMLVVLAAWLNYRTEDGQGPLFFVEEPEAHLFPVSQRRLVSIFANLIGTAGYSFFLTTHSPYILTAINNLIYASSIIAKNERSLRSKVSRIVDGNAPIPFSDVRAYTIQDGVVKDIIDYENQLIGPSIIDSVSDEFERVLEKLVALDLAETA